MNNWEKEFDRKFNSPLTGIDLDFLKKLGGINEKPNLKQFIQNLLNKQREEIKEKIGKMKLPNKEINYKHKRDFLGKYDNGYNQALSDILKLLNK